MTDEELARAFWETRLPESDWNHAAHLRMAWMTLEENGTPRSIDEAHLLMRVGIIKLNAFHGLVETAQRGYHETMTRVWLILVAALKNVARGKDSREFLELHPGALTREAPLRHYSKTRLYSLPARAHFMDPDLEPLPNA
jgi:hypothetical protein